jgi:trehalose-6-phosphate synthase
MKIENSKSICFSNCENIRPELRVECAGGIEERVGEISGEFGEVFFLPLQFIEQLIFSHCCISLLRLGGREN